MTTMKDVANLAGTSPATISRYLNKSGYVKSSTVERIEKAIKELNYIPNHNAQSLSKNKTHLLALIIPEVRNPFFSELLRSITDTAKSENYHVICCNSDNDILAINKFFVELKNRVDGIIIAGEINNQHIKELSENDIPLTVVDANTDGVSANSVSTNNRLGGKLASLHLIEQNYARVAHLRGPTGVSTADDRFQGYVDALSEKGLPYDPVLVQIGDFQMESGYEAMMRFLALLHPPEAVFVANDLMALGAIKAIRQSGLHVPNDIALIGYDNIPLTNVVIPNLSTVQQPIYEIGVKAIHSLLKQIDQPGTNIVKEILDPSLIIRSTSVREKGDCNEK